MGVSGDFSKLRQVMKSLQVLAKPDTRRELTYQLSVRALQFVDECFARSQTPDGRKWLPVLRGGPPLRVTEKLRRSIRAVNNTRGFRLATSVIYAGVHNFGSPRVARRQFLPDPDRLPSAWKREFERIAIKLGRRVMKR